MLKEMKTNCMFLFSEARRNAPRRVFIFDFFKFIFILLSNNKNIFINFYSYLFIGVSFMPIMKPHIKKITYTNLDKEFKLHQSAT